jgi:hypothetical protein
MGQERRGQPVKRVVDVLTVDAGMIILDWNGLVAGDAGSRCWVMVPYEEARSERKTLM